MIEASDSLFLTGTTSASRIAMSKLYLHSSAGHGQNSIINCPGPVGTRMTPCFVIGEQQVYPEPSHAALPQPPTVPLVLRPGNPGDAAGSHGTVRAAQ